MRVVAVLGGGGAKTLAHAGAWKALLEAGLPPSHIVGTSMGAVIGAALAAGSTSQRILDIALSLHLPPAAIGGRRLAEGGLRAVVAIDVARRIPADMVVAVDVGPGFDEPPAAKKAAIPPLVRAHGEAIRVMMAAQTERTIADWPKDAPRLVIVRAVAEREATFAVGAGQRYFDAGYRRTQLALGDTLDAQTQQTHRGE